VKETYPGLIEEMQHIAGDYLLNQGPITGLQRELTHEYIDVSYVKEKCRLIKIAVDGIEHDLNICIAIEKGEFPSGKTP